MFTSAICQNSFDFSKGIQAPESRMHKAAHSLCKLSHMAKPSLLSLFAGRDKIRDQSKFLEEICVFAFSYVINDQGNGFERKELRNFELIGK